MGAAQREGLAHGLNVARGHQLIAHLEDLPHFGRAGVQDALAHAFEHRLGPPEVRLRDACLGKNATQQRLIERHEWNVFGTATFFNKFHQAALHKGILTYDAERSSLEGERVAAINSWRTNRVFRYRSLQ